VVLLLFFVEVPVGNQRIVDMVLGVIVGSGLVSVINYFFGSSESKEEKDKEKEDAKK
jgi:phenylalanyl-tRNA synthetase beta subunit